MAKKIYLGRATTLTPVEYIEGTGTQYFDTDIIPDNTIKVEARIMITAHNADQAMPLFGCRDFDGATVTNAYILWCTPTSGQGAPSPQFNYNNATVNITSSPENTLLDVEYGNNYVKYGSQTYTGTTVGAGSPSCTMMLLGTNLSGAAEGRVFLGRLYYFKIWKGGVLVRDYVPMVDDQGEGCLWDNVEQRAFYNDGTGSFLIGNTTGGASISTNVVRRVPKLYVGVQSSYTPVEYIEGTGTQYINTGVLALDTELQITFQCTNINGNTKYICGSSDGTNRYGLIANRPTLSDFCYGDKDNNYYTMGADDLLTHTVIYNNSNSEVVLDGVVQADTLPALTAQVTLPLALFALYSTTGATQFALARIMSCVIRDKTTDTIIRNFIPVIDENNVACMFDQVENKFYYNQGAGSFTAGNIAGQPVVANNFTRKVKAAYVGVNGVARQVYSRLPFVGVSRVIYNPGSALQNVGLAATEDYIVHAGGAVSGGAPVKTVVAFNENDVKFDCADLNTAVHYAAGETFVGKAVFVSGKSASSGSSRTNQIITYDNNLVKAKPGDVNTSRFEHTLLADGTHMHVAGGCQYSGNLSSIEVYNTSFVRLSNPTSMTLPRRGAFGAKVGGYFVYCGGGTGGSSYADFYNSSNTRTRGSTPFPTNVATWYTKGITLKNAALFFGGSSAEGSNTATFHKVIASYNSNLVYTTANMPYGAYRQNGFDNNGELAFIGAGNTGENSTWVARRVLWIYNSNLVRVGSYYVDTPTQSTIMYSATSNKKFAHLRPYWSLAGFPIWKFEF